MRAADAALTLALALALAWLGPALDAQATEATDQRTVQRADGQHALPAPQRLGLHLASWHSAPGFEARNPGVYAVWANGATLGTYHNSERAQSVYAGWTWRSAELLPRTHAALTAGVVTGYLARPVMPLLVPSLGVRVAERTTVRLTWLPRVEKAGAHALHLSLEFAL